MSQDHHATSPQVTDDSAPPARVSLRALYADAMREVLEDPHKAVAEHEPWLLPLVPSRPVPSRG